VAFGLGFSFMFVSLYSLTNVVNPFWQKFSELRAEEEALHNYRVRPTPEERQGRPDDEQHAREYPEEDYYDEAHDAGDQLDHGRRFRVAEGEYIMSRLFAGVRKYLQNSGFYKWSRGYSNP
jgi:hypothetical protein